MKPQQVRQLPVHHHIAHHQLVLGLPLPLRAPRQRRRAIWTPAPRPVERAA